MDPNSQNQLWSKWVWFVVPGLVGRRPFADVKANCARFGRKGFGSSSQMRIREVLRREKPGYIVEVLTEGHPVHDPKYVDYVRRCWERFFVSGFGADTVVKMTAKLMAGSRQDGTPPNQMITIPSIEVN